MSKVIKKLKTKKTNTLHSLPGLAFSEPSITPFVVLDNNGNWKIERPLFRWVRVNRDHAHEEAKLMNIAYQIALFDIMGKRPDTMKMFKQLQTWKNKTEKQFKDVKF